MKKYIFIYFFLILEFLYSDGVQTDSQSSVGRLIANGYLKGIEYYCDTTYVGKTNEKGEFSRSCGGDIIFKIGGITIGKLNPGTKTSFFLPELLGYNQTDTNKNNVIRLMQLLQTLDSYNQGDPRDNIIEINASVIKKIKDAEIDIDFTDKDTVISEANIQQDILDKAGISKKVISAIKAQNLLEKYFKDNFNDLKNLDKTKPFPPEFITKDKYPYIYILKTNYDNFIATRNDGSDGNFTISIFGEKGDKVYVDGSYQGVIKDDWTFYARLKHNWTKYDIFKISLKDEHNKISDPLVLKIYKVATNPIILNNSFSCNNNSFDLNITDFDLLRAFDELNLTTPPHTIKLDNNIAKINSFEIKKYTDDFNLTSYYVLYNIDCSKTNPLSNHKLTVIQNKTFNSFIKEMILP